MNYIGKFISNFKDFYNEINSATLTGAIDVIIVKQPDGTYLCSPFHVRFGKIGVLRSREKVVDIEINGEPVNIHMKLGESGEAFFVEEVEGENEIPLHLATSPLPLVPDIGEELRKLRFLNDDRQRCDELDQANAIVYKNNQISEDHLSNIIESSTSSHPDIFRSSDEEPELNNICNKSSDEVSKDETNNVNSDNVEDYKGKRRKKKRTSTKKRGKSNREASIPNNLPPEKSSDYIPIPSVNTDFVKSDALSTHHEDIFHMDNDYADSEEDEGYLCDSHVLSRSVSLPLNSSMKLCNEWPTMKKMSTTFTGEFHPFSDGDVTPQSSPTSSRPPSPKSDTEYENQKQESTYDDSMEPSWTWGELPRNVPSRRVSCVNNAMDDQNNTSPNADDPSKVAENEEAEKRSMLGGMLNFMRSTKKMRHMPESEGIYLDSINANSLDPEVAALYFPKFRSVCLPPHEELGEASLKDEDTESGKGPSLPHSPHSVVGAIGGPCCHDSDCSERQSLFDCYNDIAMSLCGGLNDFDGDFPEERFMNSVVTYDSFTETPSVLLNPNLVVRVGGKYYNWQTAAPILMSMIVFQRSLPEKTTNMLINEHMPKKKKTKTYSSWWSWRRSEVEVKSIESSTEADQSQNDISEVQVEIAASMPDSPDATAASGVICEQIESVTLTEVVVKSDDDGTCISMDKLETQVMVTQPSSGEPSACASPIPVESEMKDELVVPSNGDINLNKAGLPKDSETSDEQPPKEKYKKSLRLTSEQISSLDLKQGPNEVVFSVTTAYQGTTRCKCDIYLWNYDDKIVISDIDGTITRSDVLGHILPMVGKDWAQLGVAKLFSKIKSNDYQFLYLSARAIGQARITRDYLRSIRQGEVCLPDGPLLLSPTSLISALHREVIEKKPEEFKISCLKDIQTLFPNYMGNPFYAGFGNKINDTWAYRAVGIPTSRVFTINPRGELKLELIQTFQSSYTGLSDRVDHIFPPLNHSLVINGRLAPSFTGFEEFSYFTYWREPIRQITDDDDLRD